MGKERIIRRLDAVIDGCREMLSGGSAAAAWKKQNSSGGWEWVTELDHAIEKRIAAALRAEDPACGIVGEECHPCMDEIDGERCFVIDPIDGTKEFLAGRDGFSISVALLERRRPVLGVLDFPRRHQRFWSERGRGTRLNGRLVRVSSAKGAVPLRVAVSPGQAASARWPDLERAMEGVELIPTGALGSKLAGVASGLYDAAFFLDWEGSRTPVWDFAAAGLILQEAGGTFTSLDGTRLLDVLPSLHTAGWLASNGVFHEKLLESLRPHRFKG